MDAAEEIPQRVVDTTMTACADGRTHERCSPPLMAAAVSKVLDNDDLLIEILLRLGFPTTLVRAALVCKRWFCHASNREFLNNFRKHHPPRLLGFYIDDKSVWKLEQFTPSFVPMLPQPPELASVIRHVASYNFGARVVTWIMDCTKGNIFTGRIKGGVLTNGVHRPMCPQRGMCVIPSLPITQDPIQKFLGAILSKEEATGLSYLYVLVEWLGGKGNFKMSVYVLQDGVWCMHTSATKQILHPLSTPKVVLVGNKIYMVAAFSDYIIVLDLTTSSLSRIPLPQEVKYHCFSTTLSRADNASGVYLTHVHAKELQLRVWLHKADNWLLVHTICLHEMCANLRMLDHTLEDEHTSFPYLCHVADNAEFVFLKMCGCTLYLDVTSRTLHKVHETAEKDDRHFSAIYPFMMIWPPIFCALKDDPARNVI